MNRNYIKKLTAVSIALILFMNQIFSFNAASANDYIALQFGNVKDVSNNVVEFSGRGFLGITPTQGPNYASAIIYKNKMNPRNFEAKLTFVNDYGNGEGAQSGWYAIVFSKTQDWFSSVSSVIQTADISGVVILFKLNPNNKKDLILELNRYSPGSGFVNIFGQSVEITMNKDWECIVKIENGFLTVDGNDVLSLSDVLDLSLGINQNGYVGFGGFSENHYDVKMNIEYAGFTPAATPTTQPTQAVSPTQGATPTQGPTQSVTPVISPTTQPGVTGTLTPGQSAGESNIPSESSNSENSGGNDDTSSATDSSDEIPSETIFESTVSESDSGSDDETEIQSNSENNDAKEEPSRNGLWIIFALVILVAAAAGGFYYIKTKKTGGTQND